MSFTKSIITHLSNRITLSKKLTRLHTSPAIQAAKMPEPSLLTTSFSNASTWTNSARNLSELMSKFSGPSRASSAAIADTLHTLSPFSKATTVLDIGCGTGITTQVLLERYGTDLPSEARVIASDFSTGMVEEVAKLREAELAKGEKVWSCVETQVLDAQDLSPIKDGAVSHVLASYVLFALPEPRKALKEILRVLRNSSESGSEDGGVFAMTSWHSTEWGDYMSLLESVRPDLKVPGIDKSSAWASPEGARCELEAVGFKNVESRYMEVYADVEDPAVFASMVLLIPTVAKVVEQMTEEEKERAVRVVEERMRVDHPVYPTKLVGKIVLTSGRK